MNGHRGTPPILVLPDPRLGGPGLAALREKLAELEQQGVEIVIEQAPPESPELRSRASVEALVCALKQMSPQQAQHESKPYYERFRKKVWR